MTSHYFLWPSLTVHHFSFRIWIRNEGFGFSQLLFIGIVVTPHAHGLLFSQTQYAAQIIGRVGMSIIALVLHLLTLSLNLVPTLTLHLLIRVCTIVLLVLSSISPLLILTSLTLYNRFVFICLLPIINIWAHLSALFVIFRVLSLMVSTSINLLYIIREKVARDEVRVLHVPSRYQIADIFTKGLPRVLFNDFQDSLSIRLPPASTAGVC